MSELRAASDGKFCWQYKPARRAIREAFDATNNVATALAVYDALTEIASDKQAESFTTTHAWIQHISGVGVTTIKSHLAVFESMGLVAIKTPKLRAPSEYQLLRFVESQPSANAGQPTTIVGQPLASVSQQLEIPPLATSEESQEESKEKEKKEAVPLPRGRFPKPSAEEWIAYGKTQEAAWPESDARSAFDHYESNGWKQGKGNPIINWQACCRTCISRWRKDRRESGAGYSPRPPEQRLIRI